MAAASFPDVHVTGPVHHYVQIPTGPNPTAIYYLGTAEVTPQMQKRRYRQDVMNDIAGKTLPFQKTYDGRAAVVSVALSRFSNTALEQINLAGATQGLIGNANGGASGAESRWSRGSPVYGTQTFKLWQVYDNYSNPNRIPDLEPGWYWPQVELIQDDVIAAGTQAEKVLCVFDCTPYWTGQASPAAVAAGDRQFVLYSKQIAAFPAGVLVPQ